MTRLISLPLVLAAVWLLGGCTEQQSAVHLNAATPGVNISFMNAELTDVLLMRRVNADTGEVTYGPRVMATLTLRNHAKDEAARLVGGNLPYIDSEGCPIALVEDCGKPTLLFYLYRNDRLDPGATTETRLDLPFPASAADDTALSELRLHLTFFPSPYREARAAFPVSLAP